MPVEAISAVERVPRAHEGKNSPVCLKNTWLVLHTPGRVKGFLHYLLFILKKKNKDNIGGEGATHTQMPNEKKHEPRPRKRQRVASSVPASAPDVTVLLGPGSARAFNSEIGKSQTVWELTIKGVVPAGLQFPEHLQTLRVELSDKQIEPAVEILTPPSLKWLSIRSDSEVRSTVRLNHLSQSLEHFCCDNVDVIAAEDFLGSCTKLKTLRVVGNFAPREDGGGVQRVLRKETLFTNADDFFRAVPNRALLRVIHLGRNLGQDFSADELFECRSLQELYLGDQFDQPLANKLPTGLRKLQVGKNFSKKTSVRTSRDRN